MGPLNKITSGRPPASSLKIELTYIIASFFPITKKKSDLSTIYLWNLSRCTALQTSYIKGQKFRETYLTRYLCLFACLLKSGEKLWKIIADIDPKMRDLKVHWRRLFWGGIKDNYSCSFGTNFPSFQLYCSLAFTNQACHCCFCFALTA